MYHWIFVDGLFFSFYNVCGIGANDCANSFSTSVGSGVLTLKKAVIIAAIFEFGRAVLMGSRVTDTVRKSIVDIDIFEYTLYLFPILTFFNFLINVLFIIYKGSPNLELDEMELWKCMLISIGTGLITAFGSQFLYLPM